MKSSSWFESWDMLRRECIQQSLVHPQVGCFLWKCETGLEIGRLESSLRLDDSWIDDVREILLATENRAGRGTIVRRSEVMGIREYHIANNSFWWLTHERFARAVQDPNHSSAQIRDEFERTREAESRFSSVIHHAGYLLRNIPIDFRDRPLFRVILDKHISWLGFLFGEAGQTDGWSVMKGSSLPDFVPRNCQWSAELGLLYHLHDGVFAASACAIDQLLNIAGDSEELGLITFAEIALLAEVEPKTVQNVVAGWRRAGHTITNPCVYSFVRDLCIVKWENKRERFPESYAKMRTVLHDMDRAK